MEAAVGDRIVVAAATLGSPMRDGEIIEVGSHGGPPYLVRWFDDGRETLFFPGPDAYVSHHELPEPERAVAAQPASSEAVTATPHQHVKNWSVDLSLLSRMPGPWHTQSFTQMPARSWKAEEKRVATRAT
jgi:Domain of unknown function (DUF1918)